MKILIMFLILILCFIIIYRMVYKREKFYCKANIVNDIADLNQGKVYIIQEKDSFIIDFELYYNDYIQNGIKSNKDYVMAREKLLNQILLECKDKENVVFPSKLEFDDNGIKISIYDEIWRNNDIKYN